MDNRLFIDAILWLARGASLWRDLSPELGHWKSVYVALQEAEEAFFADLSAAEKAA